MGFSTQTTTFQLDIVSDRVAPPWLQNPVGSAYLQTMGMGLDLIRYRSAQASLVRMPGQGDPSANYYIGLDRVLTQGTNESNANFILRLTAAYDTWQHAGNDWAVLEQALAMLSPVQPVVRTVNDTQRWSWYLAAASTSSPPITYRANTPNWTWDSGTFDPHPLSLSAWWRFWLLLYSGTHIAGGIAATITNATNASPIEFTTSANHELVTGNTVYIDGVRGNLGANGGPFTVTVDSATTFHVAGLNGTGAFVASPAGYVFATDAQFWAAPAPTLGQPAAPCLGSTSTGIPITNATNASPIEFTTSANHGLVTGNQVFVNSVGGNLAANTNSGLTPPFQPPGTPFNVTVDSATTFHVVGLNGSGAYTSGGYVFLVGTPTASLGFGNVSPTFWTNLRAVLASRKAKHAWLRWMIVAFDPNEFNPDIAAANQPDGSWGPNAQLTADGSGRKVYTATRWPNGRYVPGVI